MASVSTIFKEENFFLYVGHRALSVSDDMTMIGSPVWMTLGTSVPPAAVIMSEKDMVR